MTLDCKEVVQAIPWLLDDEIEDELAHALEDHLESCPTCRALYVHEGRVRLCLRRAAHAVAAPVSLRAAIAETIAREKRRRMPWSRFAPAAAVAMILAAFIWRGAAGPPINDVDAVARVSGLPMDVVAADVTQIQRYFNGKLPFAVRLPRLTEGSVQSFGGRLVQWQNRDTAYVRYELPRGQVSVFVYEDNDGDTHEVAPLYRLGNQRMIIREVNGYTVAKWRTAGVTYAMVSDLSPRELAALVSAGP